MHQLLLTLDRVCSSLGGVSRKGDPDQPRDEAGRFATTNSKGTSPSPVKDDGEYRYQGKNIGYGLTRDESGNIGFAPVSFNNKADAVKHFKENLGIHIKVDEDVSDEHVLEKLNAVAPIYTAFSKLPSLSVVNIRQINIGSTSDKDPKTLGECHPLGDGSSVVVLNKTLKEDDLQSNKGFTVGSALDKQLKIYQNEIDYNDEYGDPGRNKAIKKEMKSIEKTYSRIDHPLPLRFNSIKPDFRGPSSFECADSHIGGVAAHEFGHALLNHIDRDGKNKEVSNLFSVWQNKREDLSPSSYGHTHFKEMYAESFNLYIHGQTRAIHHELLKHFEKNIPELATSKQPKQGRKVRKNDTTVSGLRTSISRYLADILYSFPKRDTGRFIRRLL